MDRKNVGLYLLIWVKVFLLVKGQVTFSPDPMDNLELTNMFLNVSVTTDQCYSASPIFKMQYVASESYEVVYDISTPNNSPESIGSIVPDNPCKGGENQYRLIYGNIKFISNSKLVGRTFRLKATLVNNGERSTFSNRTYTFPAPFNLTGSSVSAVLHFEFTWTCHVTSDYPIIEWYQDSINLGQLGIQNKTCNTFGQNDTYMYDCQQSALTYTLKIPTSSLTKELQASTWRCKDVTTEVKGSKFMELDLVYPPTVSLNLQNTTETAINHIIRCTAMGKPNNATFVALQQRIGSTLIRNITSFTESTTVNMTLNIRNVSYQDMGMYTCLASNGIPDINNEKIQSDSAYLNVNTSVKFKMMQYTVRSDIDTPAVVRIPFYRNPPARESDVVWVKNTGSTDETLKTSANVSLSLRNADVQQTLHGVNVTLKGQSAIMNITSFQSYHEGNYSLIIRTDNVELTIVLLRSGPPDTPSGFHVMTSKASSVILTWTKGSDGGHPQTFVILYREKTSGVYKRIQIQDTTININVSHEITDLKSDTIYDFLLYSFNEKGNSTGRQSLKERTLKAPITSTPSSLNSGLVGGAAGGGVAVIVVIIVIIVVVQRQRQKGGKGNEFNSRETLAGPTRQNDDVEDGLKDNPLYGVNPAGANAKQGASAAPENPSLYAEVVKPKKKSPPKVSEETPPIYTEVDKSSKKNAKEQYQNMDGFKQTGSTEQKGKESEQRGYKNKDGLFYMDVKFDQPPTSGKPTIRKEEPTGYAMIQFEESNAKSTSSNARGAEGGK